MVTIKSFGVLSVGVMWGILSAIGGLIVGLFWAAFSSIIFAFTETYSGVYEGSTLEGELGWIGWLFGGIAIVTMPILYGVIGFVSGIIGAALYNLFAKWVGGIKVELQQETAAEGSG